MPKEQEYVIRFTECEGGYKADFKLKHFSADVSWEPLKDEFHSDIFPTKKQVRLRLKAVMKAGRNVTSFEDFSF